MAAPRALRATRLLAISGSARAASTNTALLRAIAAAAPDGIEVEVFADVGTLPVFSPDLETGPLPPAVANFVARVAACDGIIVASPEYVHALPGGFKNAIDWLVSRDEVIDKPIVLAHASHRGDHVLDQLALVLGTVSTGFSPEPFLRFPLIKQSPDEIASLLAQDDNIGQIRDFLAAFVARF